MGNYLYRNDFTKKKNIITGPVMKCNAFRIPMQGQKQNVDLQKMKFKPIFLLKVQLLHQGRPKFWQNFCNHTLGQSINVSSFVISR